MQVQVPPGTHFLPELLEKYPIVCYNTVYVDLIFLMSHSETTIYGQSDEFLWPSLQKVEDGRPLFSREEIGESMVRQRKGVELHRHVEGVLNAHELQQIATNLGITLEPEIVESMHAVMNDQNHEPNLANFINKLSTRWMRLILIKGIVDHDVDYRTTLEAFFDTILDKAYAEGIETLELLASPFNMSYEGNLFMMLPPNGATEAEKALYQRWNQYVYPKRMDGQQVKSLPNIEGYCHTFKTAVTKAENAHRFCWGGTKTDEADQRMEVGLRFCFRREEWSEAALKNDPRLATESLTTHGYQVMKRVKRLHDQGYISACDIAGLEYAPDYPLSDYSALLHFLETNGILFTVHAAEITPNGNLERARANLKTALRFKKGLIRIGHATRLFDTENADLLEEVIEGGIGLEGNATSNIATTVVPYLSRHPYYSAHRFEHAYLLKHPEQFERLIPLLGFYTDDPIIIDAENPLAHEVWLGALHTQNFGTTGTVDEMVDQLWRNQRRLAAWNVRKERMAA